MKLICIDFNALQNFLGNLIKSISSFKYRNNTKIICTKQKLDTKFMCAKIWFSRKAPNVLDNQIFKEMYFSEFIKYHCSF